MADTYLSFRLRKEHEKRIEALCGSLLDPFSCNLLFNRPKLKWMFVIRLALWQALKVDEVELFQYTGKASSKPISIRVSESVLQHITELATQWEVCESDATRTLLHAGLSILEQSPRLLEV